MERLVFVNESIIKELRQYGENFRYFLEKENEMIENLKKVEGVLQATKEIYHSASNDITYKSYEASLASYNFFRAELAICESMKETIAHQIIRVGSTIFEVPGELTKTSKTIYAMYILNCINM